MTRVTLLVDAVRDLPATAEAEVVRATGIELQNESDIDPDTFRTLLHGKNRTNNRHFAALDGFLSSWARLSLLFYPNGTEEQSADATFCRECGESLQHAVDLAPGSRLADRELRNAWMHFDERLDRATIEGTAGNAQAFVSSSRTTEYIKHTLRLMEMDTLVVHYRDL